jgi:putative transposase
LKDRQSQSHVKWDCKQVSRRDPSEVPPQGVGREDAADLGQILRDLCRPKEIELGEDKAIPDHISMLLGVTRRPSIAMTLGSLKGQRTTWVPRELLPPEGTLFGRSFWARGYCVSTVGRDEDQIRRDIREQEKPQRDQDQGELDLD